MKRYLVIGDGVAGARAAVKIREMDSKGQIRIVTDEAYPFYYRVRFPEFVAGEVTTERIIIHTEAFYKEKDILLHLEERVSEVDPDKGEVKSQKGKIYPYDLLLMATGGNAFVPPLKGSDKKGVFTLRTMKDAIEIREFSLGVRQAILLGGGLVGLETGGALLRRGLKVAVIEHNPRILPRQIDSEGATFLQEKMERMGFSFYLNATAEEIFGGEKVGGIRLKDGRTMEGEMVIISAGVRPNIQLAKEMGLEVKSGIIVNDRLETNLRGVYGAGDCSEHRGRVYGIWPAAQRQGEIAGMNMAGGDVLYEGTVVSNTLKVVGIDLTSAGEIDPEGKLECVVRSDRENCNYCKVTFKEDRIVGCIFLGETKGVPEILHAIENKIEVKDFKEEILKEGFDFKRLK